MIIGNFHQYLREQVVTTKTTKADDALSIINDPEMKHFLVQFELNIESIERNLRAEQKSMLLHNMIPKLLYKY